MFNAGPKANPSGPSLSGWKMAGRSRSRVWHTLPVRTTARQSPSSSPMEVWKSSRRKALPLCKSPGSDAVPSAGGNGREGDRRWVRPQEPQSSRPVHRVFDRDHERGAARSLVCRECGRPISDAVRCSGSTHNPTYLRIVSRDAGETQLARSDGCEKIASPLERLGYFVPAEETNSYDAKTIF